MQKTLYPEIRVEVPDHQNDVLSEVCWELESVGLIEQRLGTRIRARIFFSPGTPDQLLTSKFLASAKDHGIEVLEFSLGMVLDETEKWLKRWKRGFTAFSINPTFFVHPPWQKPSPSHPVNIEMEPGRAFGSGTHESTKLCLITMEQPLRSATTFLDIGTGSGILCIAAAGIRPTLEITALENDPLSVEAASENLETNQVTNVSLMLGTPASIRQPFDLVVANLTLSIFKEIAPEICLLVGNDLVLSGFTDDQAETVLNVFKGEAAFEMVTTNTLGGWSCLWLRKQQELGRSN